MSKGTAHTGQCHVLPDFESNKVTLTAVRGKTNLKAFREGLAKVARKHDDQVEVEESKGVKLVVKFTNPQRTLAFVSSLTQVGVAQTLSRK
jgi:hypothetical protein